MLLSVLHAFFLIITALKFLIRFPCALSPWAFLLVLILLTAQ